MSDVLNAVQIVITLLVLMAVGYFLAKKDWIDESVATFLSNLVIWVGVPTSTFDNLLNHFSADMLQGAGLALFIPFISIILAMLAAVLIAHIFKVDKNRRGVFYIMFSFSNTIFIGLPVSQALFGLSATPYALFYYMGNTTLFWTAGVYFLTRDSLIMNGREDVKIKIFSKQTLKNIISPGLVSFAAALVCVLLRVKLPLFLSKTFSYLGGVCTPLALIFIGYIIFKTGLKNLRFQKDTWGVIIGRVLVSPILVYLLALIIGAPMDMSKVFIVQSAMPVMSNAPILARAYQSDYDFASETMALTTLLSLVILPLIMLLFQVIF